MAHMTVIINESLRYDHLFYVDHHFAASYFFFFFNDPPPPDIYPLPLPAALPISHAPSRRSSPLRRRPPGSGLLGNSATRGRSPHAHHAPYPPECAAHVGGHGPRHRGPPRHQHRQIGRAHV